MRRVMYEYNIINEGKVIFGSKLIGTNERKKEKKKKIWKERKERKGKKEYIYKSPKLCIVGAFPLKDACMPKSGAFPIASLPPCLPALIS